MIKLFYIEDEPSLGKIVADSLRTRNFEVLHLEDGKDAIEHYKAYDPDICVLDVMLPSIDGFTIAKQLRALNKNIPLIFHYLSATIQHNSFIIYLLFLPFEVIKIRKHFLRVFQADAG